MKAVENEEERENFTKKLLANKQSYFYLKIVWNDIILLLRKGVYKK